MGNGLASLAYTGVFSNALNRDQAGSMSWTVEQDGSLSINSSNTNLVFAYDTGRIVEITLNGGSFSTDNSLDMLRNSASFGGSYFDLTAPGSSVTADFGADFADITAVQNQIGTTSTFRSTTAQTVSAVDNADGSFTVSVAAVAIPEPSSVALLGLGGLALILRRRK